MENNQLAEYDRDHPYFFVITGDPTINDAINRVRVGALHVITEQLNEHGFVKHYCNDPLWKCNFYLKPLELEKKFDPNDPDMIPRAIIKIVNEITKAFEQPTEREEQ